MPLVHLDRRLKGWLIGSLVVLCINLIVFIFRSHFNQYLVLGVVFFTPVAWTLFSRTVKHDPKDPSWADRDRFVLSKGHGALGLYAVLSRAGFFPRDELFTFEYLGSRLQGHPDCLLTPGVELSTGSLGQGLSLGVGHVLGSRLSGMDYRVYVLFGDGECEAVGVALGSGTIRVS